MNHFVIFALKIALLVSLIKTSDSGMYHKSSGYKSRQKSFPSNEIRFVLSRQLLRFFGNECQSFDPQCQQFFDINSHESNSFGRT